MKVKIFTEGGPTIGVGHISRCSALYEEVISRGYECEFLIQGNVQEIAFLKDKNFDIIQWRNREFLRTKLKKSDFCIVDSYLASVSLHKVIVDNSKRCLLQS